MKDKEKILKSIRLINKFKETYIICFDDPLWKFVKNLEKVLGSEPEILQEIINLSENRVE